MTTATPRRHPRAVRFEWSALLAAAFVLLVVAPALHAQQQQTLAPLYSALMTAPAQTPAAARESARSLETALAVFHAVAQNTSIDTARGAGQVTAAPLVHIDGAHSVLTGKAHAGKANYGQSFRQPVAFPAPHLAPTRVFTSHVILAAALTAGEAPHRSGTRSNRSHE